MVREVAKLASLAVGRCSALPALSMPSSRRSSRSAHTCRQPPWRPSHSAKNTAPASVSFVFAEPEQGAPLAPASQVIISTQLDTHSIHSNDNTSTSSRRVTPRPSVSSLRMPRSPVPEVAEPHDVVAPEPIARESENKASSACFLSSCNHMSQCSNDDQPRHFQRSSLSRSLVNLPCQWLPLPIAMLFPPHLQSRAVRPRPYHLTHPHPRLHQGSLGLEPLHGPKAARIRPR